MNIVFYLLGGFLFGIFSVFYDIFRLGRVELNIASLLDLGIRALLASFAFFIVDYFLKRRSN